MNMSLGEKIRAYREIRGFTQVELGKLTSINPATIRKYELGQRFPKTEQLEKIAKALHIGVSAFQDLNIETLSDVKALLLNLDNKLDIILDGEIQENDGKYKEGTISIKFKNRDINKFLKEWADMKKALNKFENAIRNETNKVAKQIAEAKLIEMRKSYESLTITEILADKIVTKGTKGIHVKIR